MSRFSGWNMAAIERLNIITNENYVKNNVKKICKDQPDYCGNIVSALQQIGIESVREYKFLHDRRFRIDVAVVKGKIAIEFEGGVWTNGRHTRGKGFISDCKKYNLLMMHGWKLLRYNTNDAIQDNWEYGVALEVKELITNR